MSALTIVPYQPDDAPGLLAVWNAALGARFPMTARLWRQNVDDDPHYRAGDGLLARDTDGTLAGFVVTRRFRKLDAYPAMHAVADTGWIAALVVAPAYQGQGIGSRLLRQAEDQLRAQGAARCVIGGNPGHFLPGPPVEQPRALRFWARRGYPPLSLAHDLRHNLTGWTRPPLPESVRAGDYRLGLGQLGQEEAILDFLRREFPGRWHAELTERFARGVTASDVLVLQDRAGAVEGFLALWHFAGAFLGPSVGCQATLGPRFGGIGPLGIAASLRGRGLGLALVAAGTAALQARGVAECAIDWTGLLEFYGRLGFQVTTSYWRCADKVLA